MENNRRLHVVFLLASLFAFLPGLLAISWSGNRPGRQEKENPHGDIPWDCQHCHTPVSWNKLRSPLEFHHGQTGFPLEGAHKEADCRSCHRDLKFSQVGKDCASCHEDVHQERLGTDCQRCHVPVSWNIRKDVLHVHAERGFPLAGVHAIADCEACHRGAPEMEFTGTPLDCGGCHLNDFLSAQNPNHTLAGFTADCESCHQPTDLRWSEARFEHSEAFQLRGAHQVADCNACHATSFAGTSSECVSCHLQDYQATVEPAHAVFGFPTECQACHNESQWQNAFFDHLQVSGFALRGAHQHILCTDCHVNNQLAGLPRDCFGCHQNQFQNTTSPDHQAGGFPTDCQSCHTENAWQPASFDHNATAFPLTGAHLAVTCNQCHQNGQYAGTPVDCYSCHARDFNSVVDPNHVSNNFSHDCSSCHSTSGWTPSSFDHSQTQFPLTGAHVSLNCLACHQSGYAGTPVDCYSCHQANYNATTNPNHLAAGFPTDCQSCHNTSNWTQTNWDHDNQYFPIYSGKHKNKWNACADCHVNPASFAVFECIFCHEHRQDKMDEKHQNVSGYAYVSSACYDCHPTGEE